MFNSETGHNHIVVLYQDGDGACDRLEWKEHIGGFLGDFYGHSGCTVYRLPVRVPSLNSSTIAGRITVIVECGAKGESESG